MPLQLLPKGLTCHLVYAIFAAVLGMFQVGYNTGVTNAPMTSIENFITETWVHRYENQILEERKTFIISVIVSIFALGGALGGSIGGFVANRCGRKRGLILINFVGAAGAALMGFSRIAQSVEMLVVGRLVIGFNCGLYTILVPMYISEIAPLNLRGGLGTVNQLALTIGFLLSQILGLEQILGTDRGWPLLLGLTVCPAVLQLVLLPFCPESPRFLLITRQREEESRAALRRLRNSSNVEDDVEDMRVEERAQQGESQISMWQLITSRSLRLPLIISIVMQLSQQLSGINAVLYYSIRLFVASGLSEETAKFANLGVGAVLVIMTIVSIPLMDKAGRRTLHLYGLGGMFIFSIFITISLLVKVMVQGMTYLSVISMLSFVVFFALGPGSIPWLITAELFSQGPRPAAMSIASFVNWFANFTVGLVFLQMQIALEDYTFLPFTGFLALFWTFTHKKVPETKNKTFDEITALFRREGVNSLNSLPGAGKTPAARENSSLIGEKNPTYISTISSAL